VKPLLNIVGVGTGHYTLDIAERIAPDGVLDILDLQRETLDHTVRKASERHIANIIATQGDAQQLPYPDDTFDAAYMMVTLREVPDLGAALCELWRVLKPDGRPIVGLRLPAHGHLRLASRSCGAQRLGGKLAYFARLHAPA
jgi:ubiquinone/menaquinone biosynthesis C-methylase UbiE